MLHSIKNARDLRIAYEILADLSDKALTSGARDPAKLDDHIKRIKQSIREYRDRPNSQEQIVRSDYDSLLVVMPLPADLESKDEADAYFQSRHYREAQPSAYDCTGQIFTTWYKIFRRRGQFWAYHATAMDV